MNLKCDAVFRKHQSRKMSMRREKLFEDCDKLVIWHKPKKCPNGLSKEEFLALPETLIVREISYYIFIPQLLAASSAQLHQIYRTLLKVVVHKSVSARPGRSEPRVRKRRPKAYPLMKQPRHQYAEQWQTA